LTRNMLCPAIERTANPAGGREIKRINTSSHVIFLENASLLIMIIMYIYHALINALSAHMIQINLNMIF